MAVRTLEAAGSSARALTEAASRNPVRCQGCTNRSSTCQPFETTRASSTARSSADAALPKACQDGASSQVGTPVTAAAAAASSIGAAAELPGGVHKRAQAAAVLQGQEQGKGARAWRRCEALAARATRG